MKKPAGDRLRTSLSGFFSRRFALFLWAVPIALLEAFGGAIWPSGWNRWIWPFIIFFGYLSAGDHRLTSALVRHRITALVIGLICFFVFFMGMGMLFSLGVDPWSGMERPAILLRLIKGIASWCLTVAVIGTATRLGRKRIESPGESGQTRPRLNLAAYCREAQLPVYVLHQTPIIAIGYYVVGNNWPPAVKFLIIFLGSLFLTMIFYELIIRRIGVLRLLFGMHHKV